MNRNYFMGDNPFEGPLGGYASRGALAPGMRPFDADHLKRLAQILGGGQAGGTPAFQLGPSPMLGGGPLPLDIPKSAPAPPQQLGGKGLFGMSAFETGALGLEGAKLLAQIIGGILEGRRQDKEEKRERGRQREAFESIGSYGSY